MVECFSVKNFDKFQHYRDRAPPWIKLYNHLLEDYTFSKFPDASKWHLIAIWLLASRSNNILPLDPVWIATKIGATSTVDLNFFIEHGYIYINQQVPINGTIVLQDASILIERVEERRAEESRAEQSNGHSDDEGFEHWYSSYPLKRGRGQAVRAFKTAMKKTTLDILIKGAVQYRDDPRRKPDYTKHPATWLNGECWRDQASALPPPRKSPQI